MTTALERPLRREIKIGDAPYTLTIDPQGLKLVAKGHRHGVTVSWQSLLTGDAGSGAAPGAAQSGGSRDTG